MTEPIQFQEFKKIPRLKRNMTITEKIDGTNACVIVTEDGRVAAQSRSNIITPDDDNYGFTKWVQERTDELLTLGPGYHFGEFWGGKIQRGYGIKERRFSLFNTDRWSDERGQRPACCHVVPVLYQGPWSDTAVDAALDHLRVNGSQAVEGFMDPEGVIVWHHASRSYYKVMLKNDDKHKGE